MFFCLKISFFQDTNFLLKIVNSELLDLKKGLKLTKVVK